MKKIDSLSDDASQSVIFKLDNGQLISFEFVYRPGIQRWAMSFSSDNVAMNGSILCVSPNIVRQLKNIISFGIMVTSLNGLDPIALDDFSSGNIGIYILDESEVAQAETTFFNNTAVVYS